MLRRWYLIIPTENLKSSWVWKLCVHGKRIIPWDTSLSRKQGIKYYQVRVAYVKEKKTEQGWL